MQLLVSLYGIIRFLRKVVFWLLLSIALSRTSQNVLSSRYALFIGLVLFVYTGTHAQALSPSLGFQRGTKRMDRLRLLGPQFRYYV